MKPLKPTFLLSALLFTLVAYHFVNLLTPGGTILERRIKQRNTGYFDRATEILARTGHVAKYLASHSNHWYFFGSREPRVDLQLRADIPLQYEKSLTYLQREIFPVMQEVLSQKEVEWLVLPIPTKLSIIRDKVPAVLPTELLISEHEMERSREDSRAVYKNFVQVNPKQTIDLFSLYEKHYKKKPLEDLFVPWDYHWSSLGITLAAEAVVQKLRRLGYAVGDTLVVQRGFAEPTYLEQLSVQTQLPQAFLRLRPEFKWREPLYDLEVTKKAKIKGRIFLAGTSSTNRRRGTPYGLDRLLEKALGKPITTFAYDGGQMSGGLEALSKSGEIQPGDLVVWEFPVSTAMHKFPLPPPFQLAENVIEKMSAKP